MFLICVLLCVVMLCFGGVLLFGAPYLPTLTPQVTAAITEANIRKGTTFYELGCGDGKVLIAAAGAGATVVGYELNPLLAVVAWIRTRRFRKRVKVVCGNFWHANIADADIIFTFLLPKYMKKLDTKITQEHCKPVKLISFAFAIPDKKAKRLQDGIFVYRYQ